MSVDAPATAAAAEPGAPRRRPKMMPRLMLAVTLALGLWIGWQEAPREVGRWYLAAAVEHRVNADYFRIIGRNEAAQRELQQAESAMSQALAWHPASGETYLERAKWRERDGRYEESLAGCEEATRLGMSDVAVAQLKANLLMHVGKPSEAVQQAEKIDAYTRRTWDPQDDFVGLNAVAYFRSLAKEKLPEALTDIDSALRQFPASEPDAGILDTRGFVLYQMGRYEEAMTVFKTAVPLADREVSLRRNARPPVRSVHPREFTIENQQQVQGMAVIYYHASLVLEKLNRWKEAKELRGRAKELLGR
jgi:tetratricopeptide (TPR) repeat protein